MKKSGFRLPFGTKAIIMGLFLIVFPEPVTTGLGVLVLGFGCRQFMRGEAKKERDHLELSEEDYSKLESQKLLNGEK